MKEGKMKEGKMKNSTIKTTLANHKMRNKTNYRPLIGLLASLIIASAGGLSVPAYAAKSWGVSNEVKAKFTGVVVDITCELTGNCPDNCGQSDGQSSRQLGLKTADQGVILVSKNLTLYTGATAELVAFCGQEIEVDGLFTENRNVRFFQVQNMRAIGGKWQKATRFHKVWAAKNDTKPRKAKRWYRKDARINTIIKRDGYLGLGLDKDTEYFNK